jgi:hypothetical protein
MLTQSNEETGPSSRCRAKIYECVMFIALS